MEQLLVRVDAVDPILLSIPAAGLMLGGVGRTTVYRLLAEGEITAVSIWGRRLVVADSVRAFVERLADARAVIEEAGS